MKKMFAAVVSMLAFLPVMAVAQDQTTHSIASISFGGSLQNISVVNGTDTPIVVTIDRHMNAVLYRGGSFERSVGSLSNRQEVLIRVDVCSNVEMVYRFEHAPAWPDNINQPDGLLITDSWLRFRPDNDAIKQRVGNINRFMKKQPGGGDYIAQLNEWKNKVTHHGIAPKGQLCEAPIPIEALTFNRVMWGSYGNVETALVLGVSGGRYGFINPPRWVY